MTRMEARIEYDKKYYLINRDRILARQKTRQIEKRDEIRKYLKQWYGKNKDKDKEYKKRYLEANPNILKNSYYKRHYGITLAEYEDMLIKQGGGCALCGTLKPKGKGSFHVDHCHKTGKIRGLLCHSCNVGIGNLQESYELLIKAAQYIKVYE